MCLTSRNRGGNGSGGGGDLVICSLGYRDGDDCADRADPGP